MSRFLKVREELWIMVVACVYWGRLLLIVFIGVPGRMLMVIFVFRCEFRRDVNLTKKYLVCVTWNKMGLWAVGGEQELSGVFCLCLGLRLRLRLRVRFVGVY